MNEIEVSARELLRLLHGELSAERARQVAERLARDPELAARYRRLAATWEALEAPPTSPPPPGFTGRVMARVRERAAEGEAGIDWSAAPGWARAAGAAALAAGILLGVGLGLGWRHPGPAVAVAVRPPSVGQLGSLAGGATASATAEGGSAPAAESERGAPAAPQGVDDPAAEAPADLSPDAALAAGYWAAIGLVDEVDDDGAGGAADEEPWS